MSNWTHVAGVVRVDAFRADEAELDFTKIFGRGCTSNSSLITWRELDDHPDRFMPAGSEGTLRMALWTNPNPNNLAAYTVSIFGDLRDHDSPQAIVDWFKDKISDLLVRQACITAYNEVHGTINWTYDAENR